MIKIIEFFKSYWHGVALVAGILALIGVVAHFGLQTKSTRYLELVNAIKYGEILQGRVVKYQPYRGGYSGKYGVRIDEGVNVTIEYETKSRERKVLFEKWALEDGVTDQEMIDQPVGIYYYPRNEYVGAASFNNPEVQFYLKTNGTQRIDS